MTVSPANALSVPLATGGPLTNQALAQLIAAATDLEHGRIDEIGGQFLIQNLAGALRELQKRRSVMNAMADMAAYPEGVTVLADHRT